MQYKYLLFDLDNTLLDFTYAAGQSLKKTFFEFEVPYLPEYIDQYHEVNIACWKAYENGKMTQDTLRHERFRRFLEKARLGGDGRAMGEKYLQLLSEGVYWIEGAEKLIKACQDRFQLVIVTNGITDVQLPRLQASGLADICKPIIISGAIGVAKPQRGFFEETFRQLGFPDPASTLMIGDNVHSDIRGGHDYGIDTCWYNPKRKKRDAGDVVPTYEVRALEGLRELLEKNLTND